MNKSFTAGVFGGFMVTVSVALSTWIVTSRFNPSLGDLISIASVLSLAGLIGAASPGLARLLSRAQRSPRIFLSYSAADAVFAKEIEDVLRQSGAQVWVDQKRVNVGDSIETKIDEALNNSSLAVFVIGEPLGSWAQFELQRAIAGGVRVIPIITSSARIDSIPPVLKNLKWIDLAADRDHDFSDLRKVM